MFEEFWENLVETVTSRTFIIIVVLICAGGILINRVFDLQIVHGEEYHEGHR